MPRCKYCSKPGEVKAAIARLLPNESVQAVSLRAAHSYRLAAENMGLQVRVNRIGQGPAHRITLIGLRAA